MIQIPGLKTYNGGKGGDGVYQTIINQIPPHQTYIELFLGGGYILRTKKPAWYRNIGIEINPAVFKKWNDARETGIHDFDILHDCGIEFLGNTIGEMVTRKKEDTFIYADPPYPRDTRKSARPLYEFEFTEADHRRLLGTISLLPYNIAISSYENDLYNEYLAGWRKISYTAQTRKGKATEVLYMNYPEPEMLHEYTFAGNNYRERERIRRKVQRHIEGLKKLPALERNAILQAIFDNQL
jgi:site-specific DNA-adenine methylase